MEIPAPYGTPQGLATTAALAMTNASAAATAMWLVPQTEYFLGLKIDDRVVQNAQEGGDDAKFVDAIQYTMDSAVDSFGNELAKQLLGVSTGWRGIVGAISIGATTTVTLATVSHIHYFHVGMWIHISTTETAAIRSAGTNNTAQVTGIDTTTGILTFASQNFTTLFGTSIVGDYLFRAGDAISGASVGVVPLGLDDWNTPAAPSATAFCGVVRTLSASTLAGVRYVGTSDTYKTVFVNALARARLEAGPGFVKGTFILHPLDAAKLRNSVEAVRVLEGEQMTSYKIGVEKFSINGVNFVEDAFAKEGAAKMISESAFGRYSSGDMPDWGADASKPLFFDRDTNVWKGLIRNYGNFAATSANQLLHVSLPT
jgi:hypothetical protein